VLFRADLVEAGDHGSMPGPARAGAVIYAVDLTRMAVFYETLLGLRRLSATADHASLESADIHLVVHAVPAIIASTITIASPPELREDTPIKLFFTVPSLDEAQRVASTVGGEVFDETWEGEGFLARNGRDPEGNIFQVREFTGGVS